MVVDHPTRTKARIEKIAFRDHLNEVAARLDRLASRFLRAGDRDMSTIVEIWGERLRRRAAKLAEELG